MILVLFGIYSSWFSGCFGSIVWCISFLYAMQEDKSQRIAQKKNLDREEIFTTISSLSKFFFCAILWLLSSCPKEQRGDLSPCSHWWCSAPALRSGALYCPLPVFHLSQEHPLEACGESLWVRANSLYVCSSQLFWTDTVTHTQRLVKT